MELRSELEKSECRWYAMRTLGRLCEVAVKQRLYADGIRYFQPMHTVVKTLKGKKTKVEEPIVANLIFVYGEKERIIPHTAIGTNFQFIYNKCSGKSADCLVVPTKKMEDFIRIVESRGENVNVFNPEEVPLTNGQKIRVIGGPLDGVEGVFVKMKGVRNRRLVVILEGWSIGTSAEVSPDMIEVLK